MLKEIGKKDQTIAWKYFFLAIPFSLLTIHFMGNGPHVNYVVGTIARMTAILTLIAFLVLGKLGIIKLRDAEYTKTRPVFFRLMSLPIMLTFGHWMGFTFFNMCFAFFNYKF